MVIRKKNILTLAIFSWIISVGTLSSPAGAENLFDPPETLQRLIEMTYADNEGLKQLEQEIEALMEEVPAARALDDPRLTLGINALPTDTYSFSQEPMTQKQIFIAQKFPWFGKLDLQSQKVALTAARKGEMLRARQLELRRSVTETYYELAFMERALQINAELNQMVSQILRVAEVAYASGRGLQQDIFQAQVELGKLIDEKASLNNQKRQLENRLNEIMNQEKFTSIEIQVNPGFPQPDLSSIDFIGQTLARNPMLTALQVDIDRTQIDIELARKAYWPDMDVRVGYGQREEDFNGRDLPDFVHGFVTVNIPIWFKNKQDRKLQAAMNRRMAAERAYLELRKRLPHQVDALLSEIHTQQENYRLFKEALLTQTDQWSRASLSAYEVGKLDFDTMINAHVRRIRFELQTDRYRFSMYKSLARLEELAALTEPFTETHAPNPTRGVQNRKNDTGQRTNG